MKKNMGNIDRIIRLIIIALFIGLNITEVVSGTVGVITLIISAVLLFTVVSGWCALYALFGVNSCEV